MCSGDKLYEEMRINGIQALWMQGLSSGIFTRYVKNDGVLATDQNSQTLDKVNCTVDLSLTSLGLRRGSC